MGQFRAENYLQLRVSQQVESLVTLVNHLMDELHNTQMTPVARTLGKGKGKEVVEDSDIEELDGPPSSKPSGSGSG